MLDLMVMVSRSKQDKVCAVGPEELHMRAVEKIIVEWI